jgi:hypothetical protein
MVRRLAWISQRYRSILFVGLLSLTINAATSLFLQVPQPAVHDEFSYLLAADTFANGRLTNPPHPLWVHFESFHILQQPTYQSKYPPGQGLMLAAGQVLAGHPMVGLWISLGLACAAVCWMLQGWLPARWALLGGLMAALHPKILAAWGQTYWGGAVAMLGGALVYGSLPRLMRRPTIGHALLMGSGLAILANSRPFEGLVASLPAVAMLVAWMGGKKGPPLRIALGRVGLPLLTVLVGTAGWIGYYNFRVTGSPLHLPHRVYSATYSGPKAVYRHRDFHKQGSPPVTLLEKLERQRKFYLPTVLTVPLLTLPWMLRRRGVRLALVTCGMAVAVSVSMSRAWPHYTAPMTGLVFLLVAQGMRHLYHCRWPGKLNLRPLFWMIPVVYVCSLGVSLVRHEPPVWKIWSHERASLLHRLEQDGNRHLVIVRYSPGHRVNHEWVYNKADIDGSRVVWAREMDPERNGELVDYFKGRRIWLLEPDAEPPMLQPYPRHGRSAEREAYTVD